MTYKISFDPKVLKVIGKWKKSNPILYRKLGKVLNDIMEHPRTGTGHPEAMVGGGNIKYSRRITAHNRVIYEIDDEQIIVLVIEVEGHYDDK